MHSPTLQEQLFKRIRERLPAGTSLHTVVCDLLFVSEDSAYRRIRGETLLVLDEVKVLCNAYSLSLDDLLQSPVHAVPFHYTTIDNGVNSFEAYLNGIQFGLQQIGISATDHITYLCKDIPL